MTMRAIVFFIIVRDKDRRNGESVPFFFVDLNDGPSGGGAGGEGALFWSGDQRQSNFRLLTHFCCTHACSRYSRWELNIGGENINLGS